jgi:hypothetical protein
MMQMEDSFYLLSGRKTTRYFGVILVLILAFTSFFVPDIEATERSSHCLNIKQVIDDNGKTIGIDPNYELGKRIYPGYASEEVSESFLIKKVPDISLCKEDVKLIEIETEPFTQPHLAPGYIVTIHLQAAAANRISNYTKRNLDKRVAIEIDGTIFAIPKILEQVKTKMRLFAGSDLEDIKRVLGKISDKIVIREK